MDSLILAKMKLLPARISLSLGLPYQIFGVSVLGLIIWGQSGFSLNATYLLFLSTNYLCWIFVLPWINGWVHRKKKFAPGNAFASIMQLLLVIAIHWLISNVIFYVLRYILLPYPLLPTIEEVSGFLIPSIVSRIIDLILFLGILLWLMQNRMLQEQKLEVARKEAALQFSQLQSLKNQLNPHFLFNTLHTINSLIGYDDELAQKLTIKVSHLLRKILIINEKKEHPLKDEWDVVSDYLAVESERFQDRLDLQVKVDQEIMNKVVPTMILQPLVENAFKHGVSQAVNSTRLQIEIASGADHDYIQVTNEYFPDKEDRNSTGVGLKNLEERLFTYYGKQEMLMTEIIAAQFIATIRLPKTKDEV